MNMLPKYSLKNIFYLGWPDNGMKIEERDQLRSNPIVTSRLTRKAGPANPTLIINTAHTFPIKIQSEIKIKSKWSK